MKIKSPEIRLITDNAVKRAIFTDGNRGEMWHKHGNGMAKVIGNLSAISSIHPLIDQELQKHGLPKTQVMITGGGEDFEIEILCLCISDEQYNNIILPNKVTFEANKKYFYHTYSAALKAIDCLTEGLYDAVFKLKNPETDNLELCFMDNLDKNLEKINTRIKCLPISYLMAIKHFIDDKEAIKLSGILCRDAELCVYFAEKFGEKVKERLKYWCVDQILPSKITFEDNKHINLTSEIQRIIWNHTSKGYKQAEIDKRLATQDNDLRGFGF